ncbi:hypothetical protein ACQ4LE_007407 [Meloidogyne hapla]
MDESMVNEFIDVTQQQQQQASSSNSSNSGIILEQDRFLPIANITRVMKRVIPPEGKLSKEAKECIQECITEFLLFITSEASERCSIERRKTISGEDILTAFRTLGFDEYVTPLEDFMRKYREANKLQSSQAATLVQQMGSNNNANNSNNNSSNTKEAEATATDGNQQMVYLVCLFSSLTNSLLNNKIVFKNNGEFTKYKFKGERITQNRFTKSTN